MVLIFGAIESNIEPPIRFCKVLLGMFHCDILIHNCNVILGIGDGASKTEELTARDGGVGSRCSFEVIPQSQVVMLFYPTVSLTVQIDSDIDNACLSL